MKTPVQHRQLEGIVVTDKMMKTIVVRVDHIATHPKYSKQYVVSKKYKVHDEHGHYHVGDRVTIIAARPMSATKRWAVVPKKDQSS